MVPEILVGETPVDYVLLPIPRITEGAAGTSSIHRLCRFTGEGGPEDCRHLSPGIWSIQQAEVRPGEIGPYGPPSNFLLPEPPMAFALVFMLGALLLLDGLRRLGRG